MKLRAASLVFAWLSIHCILYGQVSRAGKWPDTLDLSYGYTAIHANAGPGRCGCYYMVGSDVQFAMNRRSGLGALVDYSSTSISNQNDNGHNVSLATFLPGVRYEVAYRRGLSPFVHGLLGVGHTSSNFIIDNDSTRIAYASGGGLDVRVARRFELRVVQAEYLITHVPNGSNNRQNQLRLTAGVVWHLNRPGF